VRPVSIGGIRDWARQRLARPPAGALAPLDPGERVVAWAVDLAGEVAVATVAGLWLPGSDGRQRLSWHEINKASWSAPALTMVPSREIEPEIIADANPVTVRLAEPRDLPAVVRARVTRSVGYSTYHRLVGGGGVRVVGRRVPGVDGLRFAVRYDDLGAADDPLVRQATAELLTQARSAVGAQAPSAVGAQPEGGPGAEQGAAEPGPSAE
jgi:hypothetical protein